MIAEVVWVSIVRACTDLIEQIQNDGYGSEIQFMDWESHTEQYELPSVDLLGPTSFGLFEETPRSFQVSFSVAGSTSGEVGTVFRQRNLMARVFERLRVLQNIALLDPTTGVPLGTMVITDGTTLSPMSRSEVRPFQFVHVQALVQTEADRGSS